MTAVFPGESQHGDRTGWTERAPPPPGAAGLLGHLGGHRAPVKAPPWWGRPWHPDSRPAPPGAPSGGDHVLWPRGQTALANETLVDKNKWSSPGKEKCCVIVRSNAFHLFPCFP